MENFEKQPEQIDWERLKEKRALIYGNLEKYEKLIEFAERLKKEYGDYQDYKFYHFLVCSTPNSELSEVDFPGEDSVKDFIESLSASA